MTQVRNSTIHRISLKNNTQATTTSTDFKRTNSSAQLASTRHGSGGWRMASAVTRQLAGLVKHLLGGAVVGVARLLRVRLGALGDGHHGGLGPDVDGAVPVQPLDAASLDGDDVLALGLE